MKRKTDIEVIPIGTKVVFYHGVKSKKIPEGKIGIIKGFRYVYYMNNKSGEKEYSILYDVELPSGKVHRTQGRCIKPLEEWENPSCRDCKETEDPEPNRNWNLRG